MKATSRISRKCVKCGSGNLEGRHNQEDNTVTVSCKFCGFQGVYEALDSIDQGQNQTTGDIIKQVVLSCGNGWRGNPSQLTEKLGGRWNHVEVGKALKKMRLEKHPLIRKWANGSKRNIYVLGLK